MNDCTHRSCFASFLSLHRRLLLLKNKFEALFYFGPSLYLSACAPRHLAFAEEVPQEGLTESRFSIKCRWYRAVVIRNGQVGILWTSICCAREALRSGFVLPTVYSMTICLGAVLLGSSGARRGHPMHFMLTLQNRPQEILPLFCRVSAGALVLPQRFPLPITNSTQRRKHWEQYKCHAIQQFRLLT